jgi:hypothetical protein
VQLANQESTTLVGNTSFTPDAKGMVMKTVSPKVYETEVQVKEGEDVKKAASIALKPKVGVEVPIEIIKIVAEQSVEVKGEVEKKESKETIKKFKAYTIGKGLIFS